MPYLAGYVTPQDYGATGNGSTDDTAAINSALAAVASNGQAILFPPGQYKITSTLAPAVNGTIMMGTGWGSQILYDGSVATTAIAPTGNIRLFLRDLRISQSNASHVGTAVDLSGANTSALERVLIDGGGSSGVAPLVGVKMNAATCHYNVVRDSRVSYGGTGATGISIIGASHANTVDNTRCVPQGDDVNSSGIYIANSHSTTLIRTDVESAAGNGIWLDTAAHGTRIMNGYCDSNNINLKISSGVVAPTVDGTFQGGVTANVQDNGSVSPSIVNAWPNSSSNSYSSVALTNVAGYTLNGVQVPADTYQAGDLGFIAWTYDPATVVQTSATVNGTVYLMQVQVRYAKTISKLSVGISTAAATVTANENFLGLYNSAGTLVASTATGAIDSLITSSGILTASVSTPYAAPAGTYWVAYLNNATTPATLIRGNGSSLSISNGGLAASAYRFAVNGTARTTLPSPITPSSNTVSGAVTYWAAVS